MKRKKKIIAEDGFDPSTSGLWAQHAPTAPLCCVLKYCCHSHISMNHMKMMQSVNSKVDSVTISMTSMNNYVHHTHTHTHIHNTHNYRHFSDSVAPIRAHPTGSTQKLWIRTSNPVVSFEILAS